MVIFVSNFSTTDIKLWHANNFVMPQYQVDNTVLVVQIHFSITSMATLIGPKNCVVSKTT